MVLYGGVLELAEIKTRIGGPARIRAARPSQIAHAPQRIAQIDELRRTVRQPEQQRPAVTPEVPAQPSPLVRLAPGFCEPKPGGFGERTVQRLAMELVVEEQLGRQARQEVEHVRVEIRR